MIKKNDIILFAAVMIIGILVFVINSTAHQQGAKVKIVLGHDVYGVYDIGKDREIVIENGEGLNVVAISDGSVSMEAANCPGGDCMRQRAISKTGQTIVCLPNRVVVSIEGADAGDVDSVAY